MSKPPLGVGRGAGTAVLTDKRGSCPIDGTGTKVDCDAGTALAGSTGPNVDWLYHA
jgi:hypothetical protein